MRGSGGGGGEGHMVCTGRMRSRLGRRMTGYSVVGGCR